MKLLFLAGVFVVAGTGAGFAQQPAAQRNEMARQMIGLILAGAPGTTPEQPTIVPSLPWAFEAFLAEGFVLARQDAEPRGGQLLDRLSLRNRQDGSQRIWWFLVAPERFETPPALAALAAPNPDLDATVRRIVTGGDGTSPETAFPIGGMIQAQHNILRLMGLRSSFRYSATIRGCWFDVHRAQPNPDAPLREVFFLLGQGMSYSGRCVLSPEAQPGDGVVSGQMPR